MRPPGVLAILLLACAAIHAQEPAIVAHRGASRDAPENTLPAFRLAWEQGADAIEGDFHLTRDGAIVCIHDGDTGKVSDKTLVVGRSTLAELKALDVGAHRGKKFEGTTIPTLEEVFATVPDGKRIYIEIKCGVEIIPALLEKIKASGLKKEQVVVICFKAEVIRAVKAKAPQFKAFWLCSLKGGGKGKTRPSLRSVLDTLKDIKADGLSSSRGSIDEAFVRSIMKEGYEYHVWTVDDAATARRFRKWGARSITTNVPALIRKQLGE